MANKLSRSPGDLQRFTAQAAIGDVPDFAVDTGAAGRVLDQIGSSLSARLGKMADHAAANEGDLAGMNAGQAAGAKFVAKVQLDGQGAARAAKATTSGPPQTAASDSPIATGGLSDVPLQLRHDNTIRGEAFDAAAIKTYGWRMQEGLANDLGAAAEANADSPQGFEAAVGGVVKKYQADGIMQEPELKDLFDRTLEERLAPTRLAISARHEANVKAAATSAARDGTDAVRNELERSAYALGANPAADWLLKGSVLRATTAIDREVKDGTFSPDEGDKRKKAVLQTVLAARTQGTFDNLPTPAAKHTFALSIMDSYVSGKGPYADMSLSQAKALSDDLYSRASADANKLTGEQKMEAGRLKGLIGDDVASIAATGQGLDQKANDLTPERVGLLLGADGAAKWQEDRATARKGWEATNGMELESSKEIADRLAMLKPQSGQAGTEVRLTAPFDTTSAPGLVQPGNIDISHRPVVHNADGTISTELSMSFEEDGVEVLVPTVFDGAHHTEQEAIAHYQKTGEFLGKFDNPDNADAYAERLHNRPELGRINVGGFGDAETIYEAAQKHADALLEERKTDPLGQANRGGLIKLSALDTSTPEALVQSLSARRQQAAIVAGAYGTPLTVFRPEERTALSSALLDNPTLLPAFAAATDQALGDAAPQALSELSDAGPELAHAAGITLATGNNAVATDIARVLAGRKDKSFTAKLPSDGELSDAAGTILGDALGQNDKTRAAIIGTANLLYEKEANTLGFDPTPVKKDGSAAQAAYERSLNRALGAQVVNGVQYGGMADVNGTQIVAPSFLPAGRPEELVTGLTDDELVVMPPMASGNGVPIKAQDLRGAHLVTIGDGLYRVALGDPQSFDPQYVTTPGGEFWTLDMKQLDLARKAGARSAGGLNIFSRDFGMSVPQRLPPGTDAP